MCKYNLGGFCSKTNCAKLCKYVNNNDDIEDFEVQHECNEDIKNSISSNEVKYEAKCDS